MRYVVAPVDEIPPGGRRIVEVANRSIGVFNVDGAFFGLRNRCPHQGGPLCEGRLLGMLEADRPGAFRWSRARRILACPWHGWEFDVTTGQSWCDPARLRAARYETAVVEGRDLLDGRPAAPPAPGRVPGPYVAETYPLTVEDRYVVVEIRT
jgi:3-phenylpropionate/trans-cinnamate dioxygenase ferredoxin subunit